MCLGRRLLLLAVLAAVALPLDVYAFEPNSTGVVILHGKWGGAGDKAMSPLAAALRAAGFLVDMPGLRWSGTRLYARDYIVAMDEIDAAVARLKARKAEKIVIAGQSLGGNATLRYATLGRPADAFVLLAPAHFPDSLVQRQKLAGSTSKALALVADGKGDTQIEITDFNSGDRTKSVRISAATYLTYFAPDGPAVMSVNAPQLGTAPMLWVGGTLDPSTKGFERAVF